MNYHKIKFLITYNKHRIALASILCLLVSMTLHSNVKDASYIVHNTLDSTVVKTSDKSGVRHIKLVHSNLAKRRAGSNIEVLIDSVKFFHEGAFLYCDSAHFNRTDNTFEAFSNVKMEQGDTLFLYGDYMNYIGDQQLVKVRNNVMLEHGKEQLFTDSLNYDRVKNIGYYFDYGTLIDSLNELQSKVGVYDPNLRLATFTKDVIVTNPNFTLNTDTLYYNTDTRIASFISPTVIKSDSGTITSSRGRYNTVTDEALLLDQSIVANKEGNQYLQGDSIVYSKQTNLAKVYGRMQLNDTIKHVIMAGNYGYFDSNTSYAYATDSAYMVEYSTGDSLYLHADILELIKIETQLDTINAKGQLKKKDKADYEMKAYHNVRFYRSDIQGVCDSMQFNTADSVLTMYKDPILWNLDRQLTGDTIFIFMNDSTMDRMNIVGAAFSVEQKDSLYFNQLKSRKLDLKLDKGKLSRIFAEGNVESITYPEEKDGSLNRVHNKLLSSFLEINLKDGQFNHLVAWPSPVGKTIPFNLLKEDDLKLQGFYWYNYMRPKSKDDIFRRVERKAEDIKPKRSAVFDREE